VDFGQDFVHQVQVVLFAGEVAAGDHLDHGFDACAGFEPVIEQLFLQASLARVIDQAQTVLRPAVGARVFEHLQEIGAGRVHLVLFEVHLSS